MTTGDDDMNEELEAAAHEATTDKAEAWVKFTAACAAWCRDVLHSPEDHRALADAACEYAGMRVERHVIAALDALIAPLQALKPAQKFYASAESRQETIDAQRFDDIDDAIDVVIAAIRRREKGGEVLLSPEESKGYLTWLEHGSPDDVRAEEREAILDIAEAHHREDKPWSLGDVIDAIRARGAKASDALRVERDAARSEVARLTGERDYAAEAADAFQLKAAGLAAALREAKKLGTHRIAAGDNYACDVADIADEALAKCGGGA